MKDWAEIEPDLLQPRHLFNGMYLPAGPLATI